MTAVEIPADPTDPAWHQARRTFLGASDAAAVLGISPWATPLDVWATKLGYVDPKPATLATDLGHELEEFIAARWTAETGTSAWVVEHRPVTILKPGSCLACSPDRFVHHATSTWQATCGCPPPWDECNHEPLRPGDPGHPIESRVQGLVECKLVGGNVSHQWEDGPPLYVEVQARLQMHILGASWCDVASLHAGRGWEYRCHRYNHDANIIDPIVERLEAWWERHIVNGERPELVGDPWKVKEALGYLYKPRDDTTAVRLPSRATEVIDELKRTKALRKDLDGDVTRLEAELMAMLGDATDGYLDDNSAPVVTWRAQTRAAYSVPEKTYRTLRVK